MSATARTRAAGSAAARTTETQRPAVRRVSDEPVGPAPRTQEPIGLFLDAGNVLTTVRQSAGGQVRSLPTATGVAPGRVWRLAGDAHLPARLAQLLADAQESPALTARAVAVAELVAVVCELCSGTLVPVVAAGASPAAGKRRDPGAPDLLAGAHWEWRLAPDGPGAARLEAAITAVVATGAVLSGERPDSQPDTAAGVAAQFVRNLATAILPRPGRTLASYLGPAPAAGSARAAAARWAELVGVRNAAGARLVLALDAPTDPQARAWTLTPMAVGLVESTTRIPVRLAEPATFGASQSAWQSWLSCEADVLERSWGPLLQPALAAATRGLVAELDPARVLEFVDRVAPRVVGAGIDVIAPDGILRAASVRRRLATTSAGTGALAADQLGLAAQVTVDGQQLTEAEFQSLAAAKTELVAIRGRWVRVDHTQLQRMRALAARLAHPTSMADLLVDEAFDGVDLDAQALLPAGLRAAEQVQAPPRLRANLRPYQLSGLAWLHWLADNQLGGILADDMGLGKTVQVLAWIAGDPPGRANLVVCPVTLVDTWVRQAAQFAPDLRVSAYHGGSRGDIREVAAASDIVVTTYGILARDAQLACVPWRRVVLDEAQAIKNPDTRVARAARSLPADLRLAVTGTPVENHVGDLWSLLAFAKPGLLPRRKPFEKRFIGGSDADLGRLRAVVAPFVLRRAKTDPGILPDLPDREVIRRDATLTREQVGAYEAVVADMLGQLESLRAAARGGTPADPGLGRRATVLASIARLKQICVHPALLTESRTGLAHRSGKLELLVELCAQILDEGQAVVVFTQFASFVPDLAAHLGSLLGVEVATLTGSDSRSARARVVNRFSAADGPPILVASLKAGGTGLTLVRANHVIHLDRWWNPAVEDQASDRVWRIGQHQKVLVHVLVCPGTLEDRIDQALRAKRAVAGAIVRSTDTAITELSDSDLTELVALVRERVLA